MRSSIACIPPSCRVRVLPAGECRACVSCGLRPVCQPRSVLPKVRHERKQISLGSAAVHSRQSIAGHGHLTDFLKQLQQSLRSASREDMQSADHRLQSCGGEVFRKRRDTSSLICVHQEQGIKYSNVTVRVQFPLHVTRPDLNGVQIGRQQHGDNRRLGALPLPSIPAIGKRETKRHDNGSPGTQCSPVDSTHVAHPDLRPAMTESMPRRLRNTGARRT